MVPVLLWARWGEQGAARRPPQRSCGRVAEQILPLLACCTNSTEPRRPGTLGSEAAGLGGGSSPGCDTATATLRTGGMPTHLCRHQNGPETALTSRGVDQLRCLAVSAAAGHPWTLPSSSKRPKASSSAPRERIQALRLEVLLAQGAAPGAFFSSMGKTSLREPHDGERRKRRKGGG